MFSWVNSLYLMHQPLFIVMKKYIAEMIGTMVLVLMGCGSAVFAGSVTGTVGAGVGTVGVALAFGLSVVAMAYAIGGISGCHINPAITLGVFLTKAKRIAEPIIAPITWKIIYIPASFPFIRPVKNTPNVIAGLM